MPIITRYPYPPLQEKSSSLIIGPKGTGKSSFIKKICKQNKIPYIDLAKPRLFSFLRNRPDLLSTITNQDLIAIDDIQRSPQILYEVHRMMEDHRKRFLLVGDHSLYTQKKIMKLIQNRIKVLHFFPLTWFELEQTGSFELHRYLKLGGLPQAYLKKCGEDYLYNYINYYLQESLYDKNIPSYSSTHFIQFLEYAAQQNSKVISYEEMAQKTSTSHSLIKQYYQTLEDNLLGFSVLPWKNSNPSPRFYFFDVGITQSLQKHPHPSLKAFIACELRSYLHYRGLNQLIKYWQESIDFIVLDQLAIHIHSSSSDSLEKLHEFVAKAPSLQPIIVTQEPPTVEKRGNVPCLYWRDFLSKLWQNHFFQTIPSPLIKNVMDSD